MLALEDDGIEVATASLEEAVERAFAGAGAMPEQMASSVLALAGLDWPADLERLAPVVARLGLGGRFELVNDAWRGLEVSSELAPLVLRAAADGDTAAIVIAREMGDALAAAVVGVARTLDMRGETFEVVCAGGVHGARSGPLESAFGATLESSCPAARPAMLAAPPAIGAVILALEQLVVVDVAMLVA